MVTHACESCTEQSDEIKGTHNTFHVGLAIIIIFFIK